MTPNISGSSLSAQAPYTAGTREILQAWLAGTPIREEYLIVDGGARVAHHAGPQLLDAPGCLRALGQCISELQSSYLHHREKFRSKYAGACRARAPLIW
jgi:hypothetical protein